MSDPVDSEAAPDRKVTTPAGSSVACATCGAPVDPLRAERVAFVRERFRYFCSRECYARFDRAATATPLAVPRPRRKPSVAATALEAPPGPEKLDPHHKTARALASVGDAGLSELGVADTANEPELEEPRASVAQSDGAPDIATLLLSLATLGAALSVALTLAGPSPTALSARVLVVSVACAALVAQSVMGRTDPSEPHPAVVLFAPVVACILAATARVSQHPATVEATTLAGLVVVAASAGAWLLLRARRPIDAERESIQTTLAVPARRVVGDEVAPARADDLRPGEEIILEVDDVVPADVSLVAGTVTSLPWDKAKTVAERGEGDVLVGGARIVEGRARAVVVWAGLDRAFMRLTNDRRRRADLLSPMARLGRLTAERAAPMAAGLGALTAFAANHDLLTIGMIAVAAYSALAAPGLATAGSLWVARTVLESLGRGVVFSSADALDRAGKVTMLVFCARGTLLLGEPEVANIDAIGEHTAEQVLALAAGAESGAQHPMAAAVLRAARARGVRPDGARSHQAEPGLGVTAVASSGQRLMVGSRALMLKERISVAAAEARISDLEAMGRSVLLVALGRHLVGALGMQDGLRPGARAAVQHALDVGVEPVLLSGDSRETCEALGRTLDIDHIRPEVLPAERGDEIRRLADGGATVAVVGNSPVDDGALSAADVSIALAAAGSSSAEWSVQLASDDVRDAAYAVRIAHLARSEVRRSLVIALGLGVAGVVVVAFSLAPLGAAPLLAALGSALVLTRVKGFGG